MNENITENKGKKKQGKGFLAVILVGVIVGLAAIYMCIGLYYANRMLINTSINGIDVSGMTAYEIREELDKRAENYILVIKERNDNEEMIEGKDFDLKLSYDDILDDIVSNHDIWEWVKPLFLGQEDYSVDLIAQYNVNKLNSLISQLDCMNTDNMESPTDAYIQYDVETEPEIIPETLGTRINKNNITSIIRAAVGSAIEELDLDEAEAYVTPVVYSDNEQLINSYNLLTQYLNMVITYHFDDEEEVLDKSIFYDWISEKSNGTYDFDQDMIKDYVKSLASKHNTAYRKHELETSYGQTVTISNGSYGWIIDQASEREELYNILLAGESVDREPVYSQTAKSHTGNDYGDTYVEINLSAQHLFFYVDGELLVESDFVSGNESKGWSTPGGIFPLTYKERNATLKGATYSTPVSYWMPFNGNIGMHDSTWRSSYGKNIYKTNGSHGCINLPPSVAEVIFENIDKGMPVICYYLSGTEYKSSSKDDTTATEPDVAFEEEEVIVDSTQDSSAQDNSAQDSSVQDNSVQDILVSVEEATSN